MVCAMLLSICGLHLTAAHVGMLTWIDAAPWQQVPPAFSISRQTCTACNAAVLQRDQPCSALGSVTFFVGAMLSAHGATGWPWYDFWMGRELNPR
jgi:hypothetical protein